MAVDDRAGDDTFLGYRRPDGGVGNRHLVLSATGLTSPTARRIGAAIAGAATFTTPFDGGLPREEGATPPGAPSPAR